MAKRILSLILCCLLLTGCTLPQTAPVETAGPTVPPETTVPVTVAPETEPPETTVPVEAEPITEADLLLSLNNPEFLTLLEEQVYQNLITHLDSTDYYVANVEVIYVSNEYLSELEFNSQTNIYFGYSLDQLNEFFEGKHYIFTLGSEGETVVQELTVPDNTFHDTVKTVMIGGGIVLVCATVVDLANGGAVTGSIIAFAKEIGTPALKSGAIKFISTLVQNISGKELNAKNLDQALQTSVTAGAEKFAWSALSGVFKKVTGVSIPLTGTGSNGLSNSESAQIQQDQGLPLDFINNFHSMEEYQVYLDASLECRKVNGQWAYIRDIDWEQVDDQGRTNAQRVQEGLSPLDPEGESYELHHIGQRTDSPLAILTSREHEENFSALHANTGETEGEQPSQGSDWTQQRRAFWKALLEMYWNGEL